MTSDLLDTDERFSPPEGIRYAGSHSREVIAETLAQRIAPVRFGGGVAAARAEVERVVGGGGGSAIEA
jgi:hypothetical protein